MANRSKRLMKSDDKYNPYVFSVWVTTRQYCTEYAAKHAVIAMKLHGWTIDVKSPTRSHLIVAYKAVGKANQCY